MILQVAGAWKEGNDFGATPPDIDQHVLGSHDILRNRVDHPENTKTTQKI